MCIRDRSKCSSEALPLGRAVGAVWSCRGRRRGDHFEARVAVGFRTRLDRALGSGRSERSSYRLSRLGGHGQAWSGWRATGRSPEPWTPANPTACPLAERGRRPPARQRLRRSLHGTCWSGVHARLRCRVREGFYEPFERGIRTVDAWQQRHRVPAFTFAVFKKFGDDQAGNLVALLTYFAFLATFPLLLALSGILGLVLEGNPSLQASIQTSALSEFPIIGTQLQSQVGVASLGHSTPALIIGIVGAILGGQGLANAIQNTFNTVWNVPKVARPGFPSNYLRTFGLLGLLGVSALATAVTASLAGAGNLPGLSGLAVKILAYALSSAIDIGPVSYTHLTLPTILR